MKFRYRDSNMPPNNNYILPEEIGRIVLDFLRDPDMLGYLSIVAKSWFLKPNESIFETICRNIYLAQASRKVLNVHRWGSWRAMLCERPRLRTNGYYCLLTVFSKAPSNDRFWEQKIKEFPNVAFYRYLRFYNNGDVLYSLATSTQHDVIDHLATGRDIPKRIFKGHYTLLRNEVTVRFETHYSLIEFKLLLTNSICGHHNRLHLIQHTTATSGANGFGEPNYLRVPEFNEFEYYREWNWNG